MGGPGAGTIKVNFDVGFTSSNFHQVGVVARDSRANVFGSELSGLLDALLRQWARHVQLGKAW